MQAKDIMTTTAVTVRPDASIPEIAHLLLERRISAVPVVDSAGRLLGIVSEGDLMRRPETGTERHPSWWLSLVASPDERAMAYVKAHGGHARDAMTRDVISVSEEASLADVVELLEKHHIKRVPVLRDGRLCGIVSRADLLHGLVARKAAPAAAASDRAIKVAVEKALPEAAVRPDFRRRVRRGRSSVGRRRVRCAEASRPCRGRECARCQGRARRDRRAAARRALGDVGRVIGHRACCPWPHNRQAWPKENFIPKDLKPW
jgi:CBS domain-containing protein